MPTHVTARLAWHNDGWNGTVCKSPEKNTYCVGSNSFPRGLIARERNLDIEKCHAGCLANTLEGYIPPCNYSYNAFGLEEAPAAANPNDKIRAKRREWILPPATVCIWHSDEAMHRARSTPEMRSLASEFFEPIKHDCGANLVFYYANYSNPLSEGEAPRYVMIGVSRIKKIGDELFFAHDTSKNTKGFGPPIIWARNLTSAYPDEGMRLPYHRYLDDPQRLADIAVFPENPVLCKYGSRHVSDDEAIGVLEQFLAKVRLLKEIGDETESWDIQEKWLLETIAELWNHRGLYPGLLKALHAAGATDLVDGAKDLCINEGHDKARAAAFEILDSNRDNVLTSGLDNAKRKRISRNWNLLNDGTKSLLREILPRLDLSLETMKAIASDQRVEHNLDVSADEINTNPYLLSELYCGKDATDRIAWSVVDRGVLPSPDLGGKPLAEMEFNDERRFRSLCVEHLRQEPNHTFRLGEDLVVEIAKRMDRLREWKPEKQEQFTERYFEVDAEFLSKALTLKPVKSGLAVYLKSVFEDERKIEETLQELVSRPEIALRRPVTTSDWRAWIYKTDSLLGKKGGQDYSKATEEQVSVCERLFRFPLSVVTGPAGTGKTTVIEALARAVRRTEGEGANILVLAPTGKAADRARELFKKASPSCVTTNTVHFFLALNGWQKDNLAFRRQGGKRSAVGTLIVDETSMLDLELTATLFRAIDWQQIRRLILVGDPGQLPPIGRGRVFADVLNWLESEYPANLGRLRQNLRLLRGKVEGRGSAILKLSELFIVDDEDKSESEQDATTRADQEKFIEKICAGGKVDEDLDVLFWDEPEHLSEKLIKAVEAKMNDPAGSEVEQPRNLWYNALRKTPTAYQILTPHRGEMHGVEAINAACQKRIAESIISTIGSVDGITLHDKVIQVRNHSKLKIFNGDIGVVKPFRRDNEDWHKQKKNSNSFKTLTRFKVHFTRAGVVSYGNLHESVKDNLELAYAVSIHKAQGSEFKHTFVVIPASKKHSVSTELVYTALTRASRHCTLLLENDVTSLLDARRRENAQTPQINSSLFKLHMAKAALSDRREWYEAGKIHEGLSGDMLRSKSEVIIANLLHERRISFRYEEPLFAGDGTLKLPDFTLTLAGQTFYWEHLGRLDLTKYATQWEEKRAWYDDWFPGQLLITEEGPSLSKTAAAVIDGLVQNDHNPTDE